MTTEGFLRRLRSGKAVDCTYRRGELAGLISAWLHDGAFVLTWEEYHDGGQYAAHQCARTREERRKCKPRIAFKRCIHLAFAFRRWRTSSRDSFSRRMALTV